MKILNHRSALAAAALLGTLATPFLAPAQAQPRFVPGFGHGNGHGNGRNRGNQNITVLATVTRDLAGNDRFTVRTDDGRTTEVIDRSTEPQRLSRGDRVELRGDFEKQLFIADSVHILSNVGGNPGQGTTLHGRVTRDFTGRDFELNRDNGPTVRVRSLRAEPIRLSQGDRVQVQGHFEGPLFMAREVSITRNDDKQKVDFPGTVVRRPEAGRLLVRGDNGRTFTVIADSTLRRFDRDDRVRVKGFVNGDIVSAQSVELLKNR